MIWRGRPSPEKYLFCENRSPSRFKQYSKAESTEIALLIASTSKLAQTSSRATEKNRGSLDFLDAHGCKFLDEVPEYKRENQ